MEDLLYRYANEYELSVDRGIYIGDEQRKAYNPIIFIFVGDKVRESIDIIQNEINKKWDNSSGVLYFNISNTMSIEEENIFQLKISNPADDKKNYRVSLYKSFYDNDDILIELNQKIRQIKGRLLDFSTMYSNFEKINISVVTRMDDPLNVLIPEITILLKSKLAEDFKMVSADLYGLIMEKDEADFGYSSAVAMAFFREIEYFEGRDYRFRAPLEVLLDGVKLDITNGTVPIFDLVYMLGDKNEDGVMPQKAMQKNYEIISYISFLKNESINAESYMTEKRVYNNELFKNNISQNTEGQVYVTAGLSKLKRPNSAIALSVLYHYYSIFMEKLKQKTDADKSESFKLLRLTNSWLDIVVNSLLPDENIIDEMMSIMSSDVSINGLEGELFKNAEIKLYGDSCIKFFSENFEKRALKNLDSMKLESQIEKYIYKDIINNGEFGVYCAYRWTSKEYIIDGIVEVTKGIQKDIENLNSQLNSIYSQRIIITIIDRVKFFKKGVSRNVKRNLIESIYTKKAEIIRLNIKLEILKKYEDAMERIHLQIEDEVKKLEELENLIKETSLKYKEGTDNYLGQNIDEYYGGIVKNSTDELEGLWGEKFYFDERFIGRGQDDDILKRLIDNCNKYILNNKKFIEPFEDELLHRANIASKYGDNKVFSQQDLFKNLYNMLEKGATVSIYIMDFITKQRYEEKYFFGDYKSPFIQYAFKVDENSRTYKLGCVNEKRTSGIEKLNLMGGFTVDSIFYARNCYKYYKSYIDNGFEFHGIDKRKLPVIEYNIDKG